MEKKFNYQNLFDQAIEKIKSVRDPRATRADLSDLRWHDVEKEVVFDFEGGALRNYKNVVDQTNKITVSCLHFMIINLMLHYGYSVSEIKMPEKPFENHLFSLINKDAKELLIFKSIEECPFWKLPDKEPEKVQKMMEACEAESCKYIYLLFDNAYLQVIGHNEDEADPGRGYNIYSLRWFFETYFGEEEYKAFEDAFKKYLDDANEYISYGTIKTLGRNSLVTFKKVTENEINIFPYENLKGSKAKQFELFDAEFYKISKQFFDEKAFLIMLGTKDYAESIITAEWLRDSMKKARAIDLTIIALGYFKAVEQLLYKILEVSGCEYVSEDSTLGDMAIEFRDNLDNLDLVRGDLIYKTRKYIRESIFDYKDLRNGYLHKHNIHEWDEIENIREATFNIIFLLLGGCVLTEERKNELGYSEKTFTDYYRLCEYVNFHSGELFFLDFDDGREEQIGFGVFDRNARVDEEGMVYSGVYFKEIRENGNVVCMKEEHLPHKISLGKFVFAQTTEVKATPMKIKTVFEDGKFVGPSIAEEEKLDY